MKGPAWVTFRELDERAGRAKGTAFRAFKELEAGWREGRDYVVLAAHRDAAAIAALREQARIYAASQNVVLLAPDFAARILERIAPS